MRPIVIRFGRLGDMLLAPLPETIATDAKAGNLDVAVRDSRRADRSFPVRSSREPGVHYNRNARRGATRCLP